MKFSYDKQSDALSIRFSEAKYEESEEVRDGVIFDYGADGKIIGIEFLNASSIVPSDIKEVQLASALPISVR